MRFGELVATSTAVADVGGRLDKINRLAAILTSLSGDEVEPAVAFLSGSMRQGRLGVGHRAIAAGSDVPPADSASLEIAEVDRALASLSVVAGKGSGAARVEQLRALFARATAAEQDFLRRLLYGELRQGALEGVMADAIAKAARIPVALVRRAAMMAGDLAAIARAAMVEGAAALETMTIRLMSPIQPMLADSAESVDEAFGALGDMALDYKIDGARVQVHKDGDDVRIYSRTLNDVTESAPEIVSLVRTLPVHDAILDGEVIALAPTGRPQPFQETMRRFGRRRDVEAERAARPLTPFFFDLLYADGAALIDEPFERRIAALDDIARTSIVPRVVRPTAEEARAFAQTALDRGHEGVMAKTLASPYAAGRRGSSWLKIKQARTLDLVVLAAEWGHGRRQGWLSNLHLGARDPSLNNFVMLGKTFKGMTDDMLAWQTERLLALEIGRDGITVHVRPELVVEVAFNEVQTSSVYPGGVTLRFARIKRYRTDKSAQDADTIDAVRALAGMGGGPPG